MRALPLTLIILLVGCAAKPTIWDKPGGTQAGFDEDRAACEFEVLKATTDPGVRGMVAQEYELAIRKRDLGLACMRMKGYTQRQ